MEKISISIFIFINSVLILQINRAAYINRIATHPEPVFLEGILQYRLNFRDVGESLNKCLNRKKFVTNRIFRSNKFFSGWSCDKINNPDNIYSFNYNPKNPQKYFCMDKNSEKKFGISFNKNFIINDISNLNLWHQTEYKETMCTYFLYALQDLAQNHSFLLHCDAGRDRTGDFIAILVYILLEERHLNTVEAINALECDYEKTSSLELKQIGHIKNFLTNIKNKKDLKKFIQSQCNISNELITKASQNFILN